MGLDREERRYEEIGADVSKVVSVLEEYLDEYNLSNTNTLNLGEQDALPSLLSTLAPVRLFVLRSHHMPAPCSAQNGVLPVA